MKILWKMNIQGTKQKCCQ